MKATLALLAFSLLTNTFLVSPYRGRLLGREGSPELAGPVSEEKAKPEAGDSPERDEPLLGVLLKGEDSKALDQELRRLGLSKERREALLRAFVTARLKALHFPQQPAETEPVPYWKKERRRADFDPRAYHEAREAELAALGLSESFLRRGGDGSAPKHPFLGEDKSRLLTSIEKDYNEMFSEVRRQAEGFWLKSDMERMELLRKERRADMDAVLTAEDKEQIELRESYQAHEVREEYGEVVASEEEFRRLYRLHRAKEASLDKARESKNKAEQLRLRAEAEAGYETGVRAVLGDARLGQLEQLNDPDRELIKAASTRLGLGPEAEPRLIALRVSALAEYKGIATNSNLGVEERKGAMTRLAERVRREACSVLGGEGSEAYLDRVSWMRKIDE